MRSYSFEYSTDRRERKPGTIQAETHEEFYIKLKEFLFSHSEGATLVSGTIKYQETGRLPDPSAYNFAGLAPGESNPARAERNGIRMPGQSILEG
jgi:hypothetical protein